jgi:predicted transcriptional regulator
MKTYSKEDILDQLRKWVSPPRGLTQAELGKRLGLRPQYLSDVLSGRRPVTEALTYALGFTRVYIKKENDNGTQNHSGN